MDDKAVWENSFRNKMLKESFNVKSGGSPLPAKRIFKVEEEKETLRKLKQVEKRLDVVEKQYKALMIDNMAFKRKLKIITNREINENPTSKK